MAWVDSSSMARDIFEALGAQGDRLDGILSSLDDEQWAAPSLCPGWSVADVVLHLAQTEEGVSATVNEEYSPVTEIRIEGAANIDEAMEAWVRAQRGASPSELHARWNEARKRALDTLRGADPDKPLRWAAAPLRPKTLATTRLSEHWIHTLDIAQPLSIDNPDTDDLESVAWLAHRSIPYAFARDGRADPPTVRVELESPSGDRWAFGPEDADCKITGTAAEFCRVAARRLAPADAKTLKAKGKRAREVLELVRTYA